MFSLKYNLNHKGVLKNKKVHSKMMHNMKWSESGSVGVEVQHR